MHLVLSATIVITANFYEIDPSLERFSLSRLGQEKAEVGDAYQEYLDSLEEEQAEEEAPIWWRALGIANYLACGSVWIAEQYRADRADPEVHQRKLGAVELGAALGAGSWGSNFRDDKLKGGKYNSLGVATRVGTLATCSFLSGRSFYKGWKRE